MNGAISTENLDSKSLLFKIQEAPSMEGLNLAKEVSTPETYEWFETTDSNWEFVDQTNEPKFTVVAIDFGIKRNILKRLSSHGCRVIVVPLTASVEEILKHNPDGIFLSNGPGDPEAVTEGIKLTQELLKLKKPTFGICMGHQILGLSLGAKTFKLKFGHRGLNQPTGLQRQVEITSQNHGFAIEANSLGSEIDVTHINLNDKTIAGIEHKTLPFFSVQYHPEASPGPHDADYLFAKFIKLMSQNT